MITVYLIEKSFDTYRFHSKLVFKSNITKFFLSFYKEILLNWKKHLAIMAEIPFCIFSQHLLYNKSSQVDKLSVHFLGFSKEIINFISQLFSGINLRKNTQPT